jgi:tetratricopeptide (TPR) repeat protein
MEETTIQLPSFDKLWDYNNPAETERKFRSLLQQAESSQDFDYLAQLLTQIARCQALQGHFDSAHATLDSAERIITSNDLKLANVRYFLERGRTFNSNGQPGTAMPLFHKTYELADEQRQMRYAIDAVHMIAIAEKEPGDQIAWNLKGIAMAESDPVEKVWLHALLNNIGESYLLVNDYENAYQSFHRLAELQKETRSEADMYTVKDEAKAHRLYGKPDASLALMDPILTKLLSENKDDGYIRQEMAEALYALGKTNEAKPHFARAYELLAKDNWVVQNESDKLARMKELSE